MFIIFIRRNINHICIFLIVQYLGFKKRERNIWKAILYCYVDEVRLLWLQSVLDNKIRCDLAKTR